MKEKPKCKECGTPIPPKFPLKDENGNWIVKNFFAIDLMSILFIVIILFLAWGYQHDIDAYEQIANDPYGYCDGYCNTRDGDIYDNLYSFDIDNSTETELPS